MEGGVTYSMESIPYVLVFVLSRQCKNGTWEVLQFLFSYGVLCPFQPLNHVFESLQLFSGLYHCGRLIQSFPTNR